jgi:hypothetical protein
MRRSAVEQGGHPSECESHPASEGAEVGHSDEHAIPANDIFGVRDRHPCTVPVRRLVAFGIDPCGATDPLGKGLQEIIPGNRFHACVPLYRLPHFRHSVTE